MNKLRYRSALLILVAFVGISVAIASLPQARAASTFVPHPFISPTVCTTDGVCFEVDNSGHGISVEGQALNKRGIGVRGLASSTTMVGTGVSGQVFGPSSIAVNGVAFSTDSTRASEGVDGLSANGNGVDGATTFNSTLAITAASGVLGRDRSTAFGFDTGVEGISTRGVGVAGISQNGNAVTGSSSNANGIVGQTSFFATSGSGQAGVLGQDLATPNPFGTPTVNAGVSGSSTYGVGVFGVSPNGAGLSGFSFAGTAILAQSTTGNALTAITNGGQAGSFTNTGGGTGIVAQSASGIALQALNNSTSNPTVAISATANGTGVYICCTGSFGIDVSGLTGIRAIGSNGPGVISAGGGSANTPAFMAVGTGGAPEIVAQNGQIPEMSLDAQGNMTIAGSLTQNGSPMIAHRLHNGWGVATFTAQQTEATIEDLGETQLVNGQAYVNLDPKLSYLVDKQSTYLVFLTPQGDCRGLYATDKTPTGFTVRELQGGHSSIAFDYRIVAKPADSSGARLPVIQPMERYRVPMPTALHHASFARLRPIVPHIRPNYVPIH